MIAEPRTTPPALLPFNPAGVPDQMKAVDQWCCCRVTWNPSKGRYDKKPINPKTGYGASSTDPNTWTSYNQAFAYHQRTGLAMMFMLTKPFVGIDRDHVVDPLTHEIAPEVLAEIEEAGTYAEFSTSQTGIHQIGIGSKPGTECESGDFEMYSKERGFVITGHVVGGFGEVMTCQEAIDRTYAKYLEKPAKPTGKTPGGSTAPLSLSDTDLLEKCEGSAKFRRLAEQDDSDYGNDTSDADLGFANIVVRNGGSRDQVERLIRRFREREKFDRKDGDSTWLQKRVLDVAFDGTIEVWQPPTIVTITARDHDPQDAGRVAGDLPDNVIELQAMVRERDARIQQLEKALAIAIENHERCAQHNGELNRRWERRWEQERKVLRNKAIKAEKPLILALADELAKPAPTNTDGWRKAPLARLADLTGVSTDTAGTRLKKVEEIGGIERKNERDPQTGKEWTWIRGDAETLLATAATYRPDEDASTWGGKRKERYCPDHPDAKLKRSSTWSCSACGQIVAEEKDVLEKPVRYEDDRQDAGRADELEPTGTDGPEFRGPKAPVVIPLRRGGKMTDDITSAASKLIDAPAGTIAGAWLHGDAPPSNHERWLN